jgi:hypothetical protein
MNTTNFTQNWNGKLLNDCFSDIRLSCNYQRGEIHEIFLNKTFLGYAKIIALRTIKLMEITDTTAYTICGYNDTYLREVFRKMYGHIDGPRDMFMPTFQWTQRHLPAHQELFAKHWEKAKEKHTIDYRDTDEGKQLQFALNV